MGSIFKEQRNGGDSGESGRRGSISKGERAGMNRSHLIISATKIEDQ